VTNGDLLRQLFRSHIRGDDSAFDAAAEAVIREERTRNHRLLAEDLEQILRYRSDYSNGRTSKKTLDIPKDRERGFPLFTLSEFEYSWERLITAPKLISSLRELQSEYRYREMLRSAGLSPRQRVLFVGPPGCGKTLAAKVLSSELGYPLITVRFDAVISSYLGETSANLRKIFDFISTGQWLVLFDEFDAIGKERASAHDHGELMRVVSSLLQLMDAYQGESLLIAATNHWGMLDSAVWRRFDLIEIFGLPSTQDRALMLTMFLRGFDTSEIDFRKIAKQLVSASGADIERIAVGAARRAVLDGRRSIVRSDLDSGITEFRGRKRLVAVSASPRDAILAEEIMDASLTTE
jgi:SpoVK/Ycf46/Vps4 family AAA+-type ATPase